MNNIVKVYNTAKAKYVSGIGGYSQIKYNSSSSEAIMFERDYAAFLFNSDYFEFKPVVTISSENIELLKSIYKKLVKHYHEVDPDLCRFRDLISNLEK